VGEFACRGRVDLEAQQLRDENAPAAAVAADTGLREGDPGCQALAHFTLEALPLVHGRADAESALDRIFALLDTGWTGTTKEPPRRGRT
jgi:hypothetical protein